MIQYWVLLNGELESKHRIAHKAIERARDLEGSQPANCTRKCVSIVRVQSIGRKRWAGLAKRGVPSMLLSFGRDSGFFSSDVGWLPKNLT